MSLLEQKARKLIDMSFRASIFHTVGKNEYFHFSSLFFIFSREVIGKINDGKPLLFGIPTGVCRAAALAFAVRNTKCAPVDKLTVSLVHTARRIFVCYVFLVIGKQENALVARTVLLAPFFCLLGTWEHEVKADASSVFLFLDHGFGGKHVEAKRTACSEDSIPLSYHIIQKNVQNVQKLYFIVVKASVSREATNFFLCHA
jgi:hypothetical protein